MSPNKSETDNVPLVSVGIITYNHGAFIAQALDSVLAQEGDLLMEIVISDDCSTDETGIVIDQYQARHPHLFRRLDPPANVGMIRNFDRVWRACTGKYIALLEGDDWWRPGKLATQLAFMAKHPECTISGHAMTFVDVHGIEIDDRPRGWPETSGIDMLVKGSSLQTGSLMCRRGVIEGVPDWAMDLGMGDWIMNLLHAAHGKVGFIDRSLAFYRLHAGGVWSPLGTTLQIEHMLHAAKIMRDRFPGGHERVFDAAIGHLHYYLFREYRDKGDYRAARRHLWNGMLNKARGRDLKIRSLLAFPIRLVFPRFRVRQIHIPPPTQ